MSSSNISRVNGMRTASSSSSIDTMNAAGRAGQGDNKGGASPSGAAGRSERGSLKKYLEARLLPLANAGRSAGRLRSGWIVGAATLLRELVRDVEARAVFGGDGLSVRFSGGSGASRDPLPRADGAMPTRSQTGSTEARRGDGKLLFRRGGARVVNCSVVSLVTRVLVTAGAAADDAALPRARPPDAGARRLPDVRVHLHTP